MRPIALGSNLLHRFYRGGSSIAAFRGIACDDEYAPEDWVGSTTTAFGSDEAGLSSLPDGRLLREAIEAGPEAFVGPDHAALPGPEPGILVKLLDAGERLPVHLHPDRTFAARAFGSAVGKTEAWLIVGARGEPVVHVGFREEVDRETLKGWVKRQDAEALLAAMNPIPVAAGDTVYVPAGVPHAIGEGIFMVEVQEPSDLSILLEWNGFAINGDVEYHLGLGLERALGAVDRSAWAGDRLARLREGRGRVRPGVEALLPQEADAFFRAERIRPDPEAELEPAFSILVGVAGAGELETAGGERMPLCRGDTLLVPYAAGPCRVTGEVEALRCLPPEVVT
ncbi:MAG: class I mannose-6-phosphate isomerase [Actinomycetota bacterium]|nr:class I mannose-6-phosphate isomerase [Actinomycetota bacterium]MDQ2981688.1 class I mannose-6-phosphate isomerase [Actinomycetota bacterium]